MSAILVAHTDAVWDLAVQTGSLQLLSASADGTCKLWSPTLKSPLLNSYVPGQGKWSLSIGQLSIRFHYLAVRFHNYLKCYRQIIW